MSVSLQQSYSLCKKISRKKAGNFYYAFLLLPADKRNAISAIYAFMRHSDDLVDEAASQDIAGKKAALQAWWKETESALHGEEARHPVLPALVDAVKRFSIPERYLFDLLRGMEMDLEKNRYETFDELYRYCYHVASVVGLVCIYILGFNDPKAVQYAEWEGVAFQLTNILRDIRSDYESDRVYLPQEDLQKFRYPEKSLGEGVMDDRFRKLLHFEIGRAQEYYSKAEGLIPLVNAESRKALSALVGIYRGLLEKISREHEHVFERCIRLTLLEKLRIVYHAWRVPHPAHEATQPPLTGIYF